MVNMGVKGRGVLAEACLEGSALCSVFSKASAGGFEIENLRFQRDGDLKFEISDGEGAR